MTALIATLLSNAVTVTVLAFVVFAVSRRIQSQRFVHGLWMILLLKLITPPLFSLPFTFPVDDSWLTIDSGFFFGDSTAGSQGKAESRSATSGLTGNGTQMESAVVVLGDVAANDHRSLNSAAGVPSVLQGRWIESWPRVIVSILLLTWLTGSCLYVARLLVRYFRFCRFLRKNELIDEELISEGYDLAYKMGLKRPPRVRMLSGAFSPISLQ